MRANPKSRRAPATAVRPAQDSEAPEIPGPEGPSTSGTNKKRKVLTKRKRKQRENSGAGSDSTDSENVPEKKRPKRSRISATDESTGIAGEVPETAKREESPNSKHRRIQNEIIQDWRGYGHSEENFHRLRNRSNPLYDHEGVNKDGRNFYRRNPKIPFKEIRPGDKPVSYTHLTLPTKA